MKKLPLLLKVAVCLMLPAVQGQAQTTKEAEEVLNSLYGNYAPADLSAPSLLDVEAEQVSKPSSVKNFTGDIIQSFEGFKGVGVEVAPYMFKRITINKNDTIEKSIDAYRKTALWRGITLSGASVSNDTSSQVAASIGWVLYDGTDPLIAKGYAEGLANELLALTRDGNAKDAQGVFWDVYRPQIETILKDAGTGNVASVFSIDAFNAIAGVFTFSPPRGITAPTLVEAQQLKELEDALQALVTAGKITNIQKQAIYTKLKPITEAYIAAYGLQVTEFNELIGSADEKLKKARELFEKQKWNATVLQIGAGQVWRSPDKRWGTLHKQSFGIFARAAIRPSFLGHHMSRHGLIILNTQYKWASRDSLKSSLSLGARFSYGNYRFRMAVQSSWQNRQFQETEADKTVNADQWYWTVTAGPEFRVSDNLWVQLAFGSSSLNKSASLLTLANIKYSFGKTAAFTSN